MHCDLHGPFAGTIDDRTGVSARVYLRGPLPGCRGRYRQGRMRLFINPQPLSRRTQGLLTRHSQGCRHKRGTTSRAVTVLEHLPGRGIKEEVHAATARLLFTLHVPERLGRSLRAACHMPDGIPTECANVWRHPRRQRGRTRQPFRRMGRLAVESVLELIAGKPADAFRWTVPTELIVRASTGDIRRSE
jgi:hypothetical protein